MKNIHNIVAHFGSLRGAKVGFGPKHPQQPDVAISEEVTTFISKFPFLQQYPDYVEFLETYAGATVLRPNEDDCSELCVDIIGFAPICSQMYDEMTDELIIDEQGFFVFCICMVNSDKFPTFALSATLTNPVGVYSVTSDKNENGQEIFCYEFYAASFSEFMARLVTNDGTPDINPTLGEFRL